MAGLGRLGVRLVALPAEPPGVALVLAWEPVLVLAWALAKVPERVPERVPVLPLGAALGLVRVHCPRRRLRRL